MNDDEREPIQILREIDEKIDEITNQPQMPSATRWVPSVGSKAYNILQTVQESGPVSSKEVNEQRDGNVTRPLTKLYRHYLVNRTGTAGSGYEYTLSELGKEALRHKQETLDDANGSSKTKPWEKTDASRGEYYALICVAEHDDAPTSSDITDNFVERSHVSKSDNGPEVTPYLSTAFQKGLVNRTPKPYRYWLTEDGEEVLKQG